MYYGNCFAELQLLLDEALTRLDIDDRQAGL